MTLRHTKSSLVFLLLAMATTKSTTAFALPSVDGVPSRIFAVAAACLLVPRFHQLVCISLRAVTRNVANKFCGPSNIVMPSDCAIKIARTARRKVAFRSYVVRAKKRSLANGVKTND